MNLKFWFYSKYVINLKTYKNILRYWLASLFFYWQLSNFQYKHSLVIGISINIGTFFKVNREWHVLLKQTITYSEFRIFQFLNSEQSKCKFFYIKFMFAFFIVGTFVHNLNLCILFVVNVLAKTFKNSSQVCYIVFNIWII